MSRYIRQNRLKLVDQTLMTMGAAGYDLTQADVEFIWRVGAGTATQAEVEVWTRQMAVKLDGKSSDPSQALQDLKAMAARVMADIHALSTSITAVSPP